MSSAVVGISPWNGFAMAMCRRGVTVAFIVSVLVTWLLISDSTPNWILAVQKKSNTTFFSSTNISHFKGQLKTSHLPQKVGKKPTKGKLKILLLTYMRSGSTFVGSMLGANKDIFYVLEPLRAIATQRNALIHFLNGSNRYFDYENYMQQIISDVFKCELQSLSVETLKDVFWAYSSDGGLYRKCLGSHPSMNTVIHCLPYLTLSCSKKSTTAIKSIRYPMRLVEGMIQKDQSLKVIHLIRDPRPTLFSHLKWKYVGSENLDEYSHRFCGTIHADIVAARRISTKYPDNIKQVLYEDVTKHTVKVVKDIYEFLDLPFSQEVVNHIVKLKSRDSSEKCFMCTYSSNSTYQLLKWRTLMNYADVKIIDKNCQKVYTGLGYLPVKTEDILRDLVRPLRTKFNMN